MVRFAALCVLLTLSAAWFDGAIRVCAMSERAVGCPCDKAAAEGPLSFRKAVSHDCCDELTFGTPGDYLLGARDELVPPAALGTVPALTLPGLVAAPAPEARGQDPPQSSPLYLAIRTLLI